jgi:hypothetical protein
MRHLRYVIALSRIDKSPPILEDDLTTTSPIASLLQAPPRVVNIGLPEFADELRAAEIAVLQLDWSPPVIADPRIRALLAKLS